MTIITLIIQKNKKQNTQDTIMHLQKNYYVMKIV